MPEVLKGWSIDHRIPLALIFALMVQTAGIVWWASAVNSQVDEHTRRLIAVEHVQAERFREERDNYRRLGTIDASLLELQRGIARLDTRLDQLNRQWDTLTSPRHGND